MNITPIFLLSLPRSGSTLLQRLLGQHAEISTEPEPWIAIPLLFAIKEDGITSVYGHNALSHAVNGFIGSFPKKHKDYFEHVGIFLRKLYSLSSNCNAKYFLDKTPRYHLISKELLYTFPDAKYIFLWRNPLSIASSMIQTWGNGRWNLFMFSVDMYAGIDSLVRSYSHITSKAISLRYEDLVVSPKKELERIFAYLKIDSMGQYRLCEKHEANLNMPGRGDPTGHLKYRNISDKSISIWKNILNNPFRRAWARKYLEWIGKQRLEIMGYNYEALLDEIYSEKLQYRFLASDLIRYCYGKYYCRFSIGTLINRKSLFNGIYLTYN